MKFPKNRKTARSYILIFLNLVLVSGSAKAQQVNAQQVSPPHAIPPQVSVRQVSDSRLSAGVIFGNPLGATMRYRLATENAVDVSFGPDYFGSPRLQMDYVWQFHAFRSRTVGEYFGPGLAVAFAKGINTFYTHERGTESFAANEDKGFGVGGRAIFGMSITPNKSPLEFFMESGPMIPMSRIFDLDLDGAIGFRYRL